MGKNYCKVDHKWCKHCKHCLCFYNNNVRPLNEIKKCPIRENYETISFRNLLNSVKFEDVFERLTYYWKNEVRNLEGYRKVFNQLKTMKGVRCNWYICCTLETYSDGSCINVFAKRYDKLNIFPSYAMDFTPWNEVVTMNISPDSLENFSYEDIVAGVLYEITFNGFDEEKINNTYNKIISNFEEMKNAS